MKLSQGERIVGMPVSWQGDPLRCIDCGELIGPKERVVVIHKGESNEQRIIVPSVGCRCNRRPPALYVGNVQ